MVVDTLLARSGRLRRRVVRRVRGTLRALRVYFDPETNSVFLPYEGNPPGVRGR